MLDASRWKAAAALALTLFLCLAAVPNLLPQRAFDSLPAWAQRKVELGYDLQGGSRLLLQIDREDVRKQMVDRLRDDVRKILREARVPLVSAPALRGTSVEVRLRDADNVQTVLARMHAFFDPLGSPENATRRPSNLPAVSVPAGTPVLTAGPGQPRAPEVVIASEDNLIRLTVTEAAIAEQIQVSRQQSMYIVERRVQDFVLGRASVRPAGVDLILVEAPGSDVSPILNYAW